MLYKLKKYIFVRLVYKIIRIMFFYKQIYKENNYRVIIDIGDDTCEKRNCHILFI